MDNSLDPNERFKLIRSLSATDLLAELYHRHDLFGDHCIRMVTPGGDYRVIAPTARLAKDGTLYINNVLSTEEARKDGLGNPIWTQIGDRLLDNASYNRSDPSVTIPRDQFNIIFKLLARCER